MWRKPKIKSKRNDDNYNESIINQIRKSYYPTQIANFNAFVKNLYFFY